MAKPSTLFKGISSVGSFTRGNLERMGAMIDSVNAKSGKPRQFKAVNLGDEDYQQDLFREQTLKPPNSYWVRALLLMANMPRK